MSSVLDELREEGRAEGRVEGRVEGRRESSFQIAERLILSGKMSDEEIAAITKLTLEEVKELSKREI